jgi:hypothetical protein
VTSNGDSSIPHHNTHTVSSGNDVPLAVLWRLQLNDSRIACRVYRDGGRLQLCVESATAVIVREPFELEPRAMARARMLRENLKRRGWVDDPAPESPVR